MGIHRNFYQVCVAVEREARAGNVTRARIRDIMYANLYLKIAHDAPDKIAEQVRLLRVDEDTWCHVSPEQPALVTPSENAPDVPPAPQHPAPRTERWSEYLDNVKPHYSKDLVRKILKRVGNPTIDVNGEALAMRYIAAYDQDVVPNDLRIFIEEVGEYLGLDTGVVRYPSGRKGSGSHIASVANGSRLRLDPTGRLVWTFRVTESGHFLAEVEGQSFDEIFTKLNDDVGARLLD